MADRAQNWLSKHLPLKRIFFQDIEIWLAQPPHPKYSDFPIHVYPTAYFIWNSHRHLRLNRPLNLTSKFTSCPFPTSHSVHIPTDSQDGNLRVQQHSYSVTDKSWHFKPKTYWLHLLFSIFISTIITKETNTFYVRHYNSILSNITVFILSLPILPPIYFP